MFYGRRINRYHKTHQFHCILSTFAHRLYSRRLVLPHWTRGSRSLWMIHWRTMACSNGIETRCRRGWWRRSGCLIIGAVDESRIHHLSNAIDFIDVGSLFRIQYETCSNEKTKLTLEKDRVRHRSLSPAIRSLQMNRNSLAAVCNPMLRFFDVREWDSSSLRRKESDAPPSRTSTRISLLIGSNWTIEMNLVENTAERPDVRSKVVAKIVFMNAFRRHVISKRDVAEINGSHSESKDVRCSNHWVSRRCFWTEESTLIR